MTTSGIFSADATLMRRVAERDSSALQVFVRRVLPRAQRLCQALLRNPVEAKDASQTAILQVLQSAHTFRGECSIEHWSDRIVARTALRWVTVERRARHAPVEHEPASAGDVGQPRVLLKECIQRLPEVQRTALLLRTCFEYSVDEIASLTNVSRNTVKDRLTRARQTLRAFVRAPEDAPRFDVDGEAATMPLPRLSSPPQR
jgi:RNA polymerase sigma-70 factor (ECF subfamily)